MDINDQVLRLIGNKVGLVKRYETALKTAEEFLEMFLPFGCAKSNAQYLAIKVLNHFIKADIADMQGAKDSYTYELHLISQRLDELMDVLADGMLTRRVSFYASDEANHVAA